MKFLYGGIALALIAAAIGGYAFLIEPKRLLVKEYELPQASSDAAEEITIAQFSDVHISKSFTVAQLEEVVNKINEQEPDLIVFTGDLFDNFAKFGPSTEVAQVLAQLDAPLGKFAVWGNHDYGGGAARIYPEVLAEAGFQLLTNEAQIVTTANGRTIKVGGSDEGLQGQPSLTDALAGGTTDYTILLSHEPDLVTELPETRVDLVLSGHSHGGQVRLPFYTVKNALAKIYYRGFYTLERPGATQLFVNTGLGTTEIPVRLGVPPEVSVFRVKV